MPYASSICFIGIDVAAHDIRFVEDNWESPVICHILSYHFLSFLFQGCVCLYYHVLHHYIWFFFSFKKNFITIKFLCRQHRYEHWCFCIQLKWREGKNNRKSNNYYKNLSNLRMGCWLVILRIDIRKIPVHWLFKFCHKICLDSLLA